MVGGPAPWRAFTDRPDDDFSHRVQPSHDDAPDRPRPHAEIRQSGQYSRTGILRYEMIFGEHYISTGGHATTDDLCARLGSSLRPGVRVLDVGSGIGGAAFHLAKPTAPR